MGWRIVDSTGRVKGETGGGWQVITSIGYGKQDILDSVVDHGSIGGLTDDDHTQYALLLGRASSQIIRGGTGASETLTLRGTSNATTGLVALNDLGGNVAVGGGATASELRVLEASGSGTNYTSFTCPPLSANVNYTLPVDDGDANQVLSTNGSGTLDWVADGGTTTLGTEQASTSGTSITFTGIPAGTKVITISFIGISHDGTSSLLVRIGDSGGIEDTGYQSGTYAIVDSTTPSVQTSTTGFISAIMSGGTNIIDGHVTLILEDSSDFTWTITGSTWQRAATAYASSNAGSKSLSAELTQVRVTMVNGTDNFDAGAINISYHS